MFYKHGLFPSAFHVLKEMTCGQLSNVKRDHLTKKAVNSPVLSGNFEEPIFIMTFEIFTIPCRALLPTCRYDKKKDC